MSRIILISGDGIGAGKTTLAERLGWRLSLAQGIREDLEARYPSIPWHSTDQETKSQRFEELGGRTMREVMIQYGQERCAQVPDYWVERWSFYADAAMLLSGIGAAVVDDLRKIVELESFRRRYGAFVTHLHVEYPGAIPEPQYDNEQLKARADYIIRRP